jgi:hypothetical protein
MAHDVDSIAARVMLLERQLRVFKIVAAGALVLAVTFALVPRTSAQQASDVLRVRQLIVEDGDRNARMILGYLDAPGNTRRFGMRINDPRGVERFGLSYIDNGSLVMGFDAPPGTGDERNRERINLVADEQGGAHIRFLDRRTSVASLLYLDDQNRAWMQFSDFTRTPAAIRRYGLNGEEVVQPK